MNTLYMYSVLRLGETAAVFPISLVLFSFTNDYIWVREYLYSSRLSLTPVAVPPFIGPRHT